MSFFSSFKSSERYGMINIRIASLKLNTMDYSFFYIVRTHIVDIQRVFIQLEKKEKKKVSNERRHLRCASTGPRLCVCVRLIPFAWVIPCTVFNSIVFNWLLLIAVASGFILILFHLFNCRISNRIKCFATNSSRVLQKQKQIRTSLRNLSSYSD